MWSRKVVGLLKPQRGEILVAEKHDFRDVKLRRSEMLGTWLINEFQHIAPLGLNFQLNILFYQYNTPLGFKSKSTIIGKIFNY
jgi:hypothetical protein